MPATLVKGGRSFGIGPPFWQSELGGGRRSADRDEAMGRWGMSADSALMAFEAFSAPEFSITIPPKKLHDFSKILYDKPMVALAEFLP
ncbi:hypothetical protein [Caulobacter sp.]|jgi:hypothetical protein|uniref:hypothetical protein n=1 Tax=Caulobacter sp. TaxID=78 RepID=UPI00161E1C36